MADKTNQKSLFCLIFTSSHICVWQKAIFTGWVLWPHNCIRMAVSDLVVYFRLEWKLDVENHPPSRCHLPSAAELFISVLFNLQYKILSFFPWIKNENKRLFRKCGICLSISGFPGNYLWNLLETRSLFHEGQSLSYTTPWTEILTVRLLCQSQLPLWWMRAASETYTRHTGNLKVVDCLLSL